MDWSEICNKYKLDIHYDTLRKAQQTIFGGSFVYNYFKNKGAFESKDNKYLKELEDKKSEIQKERYKFFDQRNAYNKLLRERSRQEELNEIIKEVINNGYLPTLEYKEKTLVENSENDMLISLNDLHIGADINNSWNVYNSEICKERLVKYLDEILEIQKTNKCENAIVWVNGDIISGNIHKSIAITNKENVIQQVITASELISQFLSELSPHFKTLKFVTVAGNHSRFSTKEDSLKDERLDILVEWYLQARLQGFINIIFNDYEKLDTTMYLVNVRGLNYIGTHGDYDDSISKIQALQMMVGKPIYAVLLGHLHHNKIDSIQGVKTVMAGSFLGVDDYCISKRIFGKPEQLVCICNSKGIKCWYGIEF